MTWLSFKAKLAAAGTIALGVILVMLKYFMSKAKKEERRADVAEANVERVVKTQKRETEIDQEYSHRAEVANEQIQDGAIPDHLAKRRVR